MGVCRLGVADQVYQGQVCLEGFVGRFNVLGLGVLYFNTFFGSGFLL